MILTSLLVMGGVLGLFVPMGCVSSSQTKVTKPVAIKLRQYEVLALDTKFSSSHASDEEMILDQLDRQIIRRLRQTELFEKVYSTRASVAKEYDVKLRVTILESNSVGQAFIKADFILVDSKTGNHLGEAQAEGESSAGYSSSGTIFQAIELLAKEAVTYVVQYY